MEPRLTFNSSSDFLLSPPLPPLKIKLDEENVKKENIALPLPKRDRPDAKNISPGSMNASDDFITKDDTELPLPQYFSTPIIDNNDRRKFVRYNSQPARKINFTCTDIEGSPQHGSTFRTPDFTKLKNAITPDSGFSTPSAVGEHNSPSSPILSMFDGFGLDKSTPSTAVTSEHVSTFQGIENTSSSKLAACAKKEYSRSTSATSKLQVSDESVLDKSLDLPSWLSNFCQAQSTPVASFNASSKATSVKKKTKKIPLSIQSQSTPCRPDRSNLPGILSLQQLTPVPVVMAPTLPSFTAASLQEGSSTSKAKSAKRKPLEELQQNSQSSQQSEDERPNHSYMDLIKMALESAPNGQMTLKEIISWIEDHFLYFKLKAKHTWKNSIRHNLSLHHDFTKVEEKRHGGKWKLAADAKKYAHRIPKPPVVKPPPKSPPVICVKKRKSGLQPILPKTMPYALFPIALTTVDCQGIRTEHCLEETSQQEQPQIYCHRDLKPQIQSHQQNSECSYQDEQHHQFVHRSSSKQPQQQQPQEVPQGLLQSQQIKLHFQLTPQQKQVLQHQRQSLLGSSSSQGSTRPSVPHLPSKFQPSNAITQNFPLLHMSDHRRRLKASNRNSSTILPLLAPKPNPHQTNQPLSVATKPMKILSSADKSLTNLSTLSNSKHSKGVHKNKNICRILDRMPKSKSFDVGSKKKPMKNSTKNISKSTKFKASTSEENFPSVVDEDMQAAQEIDRILQQRDGCILEPVVQSGKDFAENSIWQGDIRPESEPGRDLLLQAWEETLSPFVWDEDSKSSCFSSGMEDSQRSIPSSYVISQALSSMPVRSANSLMRDETFNFVLKDTQRSEETISSQNSRSPPQSISQNNMRSTFPSNSEKNLMIPTDHMETSVLNSLLPNNLKDASTISKKCRTSCEVAPAAEPTIQCTTVVAQADFTPQRRPGLYRTKSRRKQIHIPLQIDLSPKRDSGMTEQDGKTFISTEVCRAVNNSRDAKVNDLRSEQIRLLRTDDISNNQPHVSIKPSAFASNVFQRDDRGQPLCTALSVSIPNSDTTHSNPLQPTLNPIRLYDFDNTTSSLFFSPNMNDFNAVSNGALDLSPSSQSNCHQNQITVSASCGTNQDLPRQSHIVKQHQNRASLSSQFVSTTYHLDENFPLQHSNKYNVLSSSSCDSVPSHTKSEVLLQETNKTSTLSNWHDNSSIHIAPVSNIRTAFSADNVSHFPSPSNKMVPYQSISEPDTLIQSVPSQIPDFNSEYFTQQNLNHQTLSLSKEECGPVKKHFRTTPLVSLPNLPWNDQNHQDPGVDNSPDPQPYRSFTTVTEENSRGHVTCDVMQKNGICHVANQSPQTLCAVPNHCEWHCDPRITSPNPVSSSVRNFITPTTTTMTNPSTRDNITSLQQGEREHEFPSSIFTLSHTSFGLYQEDCPKPEDISKNSALFFLEHSVLPQQLEARQQASLESSPADVVAVLPQGLPATEDVESDPRLSPAGEEEEEAIDTAGSDSSFLNNSVFDNIDSLMHTSLTETNLLLKD